MWCRWWRCRRRWAWLSRSGPPRRRSPRPRWPARRRFAGRPLGLPGVLRCAWRSAPLEASLIQSFTIHSSSCARRMDLGLLPTHPTAAPRCPEPIDALAGQALARLPLRGRVAKCQCIEWNISNGSRSQRNIRDAGRTPFQNPNRMGREEGPQVRGTRGPSGHPQPFPGPALPTTGSRQPDCTGNGAQSLQSACHIHYKHASVESAVSTDNAQPGRARVTDTPQGECTPQTLACRAPNTCET